jgi:hypothetical protein
MADTSQQAGVSGWGPLIGAGAQGLVNYFGNQNATNSLVQGNTNAIGTQTGLQGQLTGIYGNQRGLGNGADTTLAAQLGLSGTPDFSAFENSPGFQGSLALGNQAIERAASSNGSLYTPNMLNQLGQYDTTYASQNYNNYITQLMSAAGLGAQGNQGLGNNIYGTGANISQLQQNQGVNKAGGAANQSGIVSNLISKVPWSSVGNSVSNWWNGTGTGNGSTGGYSDTTNGTYNGGAFGGGAPLYDPNTGGYPGASTGSTDGNINWLGDSGNPS